MGAASSFLNDANMCCREEDYDDDRGRSTLLSKRSQHDGKFGTSTSSVWSSASTCVATDSEQTQLYCKRPVVVTDEGYWPIWIA
jgi:hypothetical protein